jgi:superfamily II DNA or RNA helicase
MKLRPYQQTAITQINEQFQAGKRSVLYQLPTGGGKTVIFSDIIFTAVQASKRVCVLVHRVELLNQAAETLRSLGIPNGRIKGKVRYDPQFSVHVASVQTLSRNTNAYPPDLFDLLVIDEAHHAVAGSWDRVIKRFRTAKVLGVTATPCRLDGRGLGGCFQTLIQGPQLEALQDDGFLAQSKVYAPPALFDQGRLKTSMGDFQMGDASARLATVKVIGDVLSHYRRHLNGGTAIAFCCSIAHAESVASAFNEAGITAASIDGTMTEERRTSLLSSLSIGSIKVLTSCALIGEGVDVPSVSGCILLRPTKSLALHLQMVGRCLRPDGGKPAVILDHVGNYQRLGHHLLHRTWSLDDGVSLGCGRSGIDRMSTWLCQACDFLAPTELQECPECGSPRPATKKEIVTIEAELVAMAEPRPTKAELKVKRVIDAELAKWESEPLKRDDPVLIDFPMGYFARYAPWRSNPDPTPDDCVGTVRDVFYDARMVAVRLRSHALSDLKELVPIDWVRKDCNIHRLTLEAEERTRAENRLYTALENDKKSANTLDELIAVAHKYNKRNPVGWAKVILWHRNRPAHEYFRGRVVA